MHYSLGRDLGSQCLYSFPITFVGSINFSRLVRTTTVACYVYTDNPGVMLRISINYHRIQAAIEFPFCLIQIVPTVVQCSKHIKNVVQTLVMKGPRCYLCTTQVQLLYHYYFIYRSIFSSGYLDNKIIVHTVRLLLFPFTFIADLHFNLFWQTLTNLLLSAISR